MCLVILLVYYSMILEGYIDKSLQMSYSLQQKTNQTNKTTPQNT